MTPFIHSNWHVWQGTSAILLSNESEKRLRQFKTTDDAVNWLFVNGHRDTARALNDHIKGIV